MNKSYKIALLVLFFITVSFWIFHTLHKPGLVTIRGRVAIVLDDWGYNSTDVPYLLEIKNPLTIAILPNLRYSKQIAEEARKNGYQVILHLPLESKGNEIPEKDTLYCAMNKDEITRRLKLILKSIPEISGVNNHQGSRATEDAKMMRIVLSELKKEKLFFLDSFTTHKSVCSRLAKTIEIRYAKRDIFLDTPHFKLKEEELYAYIQEQLYKLGEIARHRGYAIGIGHDRRITLSVLRDVMPQLEKKGIRFVFLSELVR